MPTFQTTPIAEDLALKTWTYREHLGADGADLLTRYEKQQEDLGLPLWPSQVRQRNADQESMQKLFSGLDEVTKQYSDASQFAGEKDFDEIRAHWATRDFLASRYNADLSNPDDVTRHMADYATKQWGDASHADTALKFYQRVGQDMKQEAALNETRSKAWEAGTSAALLGQDSVRALAEFQRTIPKLRKGEQQDQASLAFSVAFQKVKNKADGVGDLADRMLLAAQQFTEMYPADYKGDKPLMKPLNPFADLEDEMVMLTPGQRKIVLSQFAAKAEQSDAKTKDAVSQTMDYLQRNMAGMVHDVAQTAKGVALGIGITDYNESGDPTSPPDQASLDQLSKHEARGEVYASMRKAMEGGVAPIKPVLDWLQDDIETGMMKAPGAVLPSMMLTMAGGMYGGAALLSAQLIETNRTELREAGLSPADARLVSTIAAPFQGAIENLSNLFMVGKLPAVNRVLSQFVKPIGTAAGQGALARYGINAAANVGVEFTEEQLQDNYIVPKVRDVLNAIGEDIGGPTWQFYEERAIAQTPELLSIIVPTSLLFGGFATMGQVNLSHAVVSDQRALELAGFSMAQANEIRMQDGTDARIDKARELWTSRAGDRQSVAAAVESLGAEMQERRKDVEAARITLEQRGEQPAVQRTADGTAWQLYFDRDKSTATFATPQEAGAAALQYSHDMGLRIQGAAREFLTTAFNKLEPGRGLQAKFPQGRLTTDQAQDQGVMTAEQVALRSQQADALEGRTIDDAVVSAEAKDAGSDVPTVRYVMGSSVNEMKHGIMTTVMRLWQGADLRDLAEEKIEGDFKLVIADPKRRQWALDSLREYERLSGAKLFRDVADSLLQDSDLVEAWSSLGRAVLLTSTSKGKGRNIARTTEWMMKAGLGGALNAESEYWNQVAAQANKVKEYIAKGHLKGDVVALLEKQLGIDSQESHEAAVTDLVATEMADTSGYSESSPGPNGETFSLTLQKGLLKISSLPRDIKEAMFNEYAVYVNNEATEAEFYRKQVPHGTIKINDLKIDKLPDSQIQPFGGIDSMPPIIIADGKLLDGQHRIQSAKNAGQYVLRYIDISGLTDTSRDAAGYISMLPTGDGETFSLRVTPAQDAEYMAAVESGDVAKQQAMVDAKLNDALEIIGNHQFNEDDARYAVDDFLQNSDVGLSAQESESVRPYLIRYALGMENGWRPPFTGKIYGKLISAKLRGEVGGMSYFIGNAREQSLLAKLAAKGMVADGRVGQSRYVIAKVGGQRVTLVRVANHIEGTSNAIHGWPLFSVRFDGVHNSNALENGVKQKLKSADPITRDADGNVIPLSQRFNPERNEITYSLRKFPVPPGLAEAAKKARGESSLILAYQQAQRGSSSAMVPIRAVYEAAKKHAPALTPAAFMQQINALNDSGSVLIGLSETTRAVEAAGEFRVGGAGTEVAFAPQETFSLSAMPKNEVAAKDAFESAVKRHGLTRDIAEAGYILPDGRLLDFTGRADAGYKRVGDFYVPVKTGERDWMKGERGVDHREIEWEGMPPYKETWMPMVEFMRMGAVRIDKSGAITIHGRQGITAAQKSRLADLLIESDGSFYLDMEDDDGKRGAVSGDGAKIGKVAGFIQKWKDGWTPDSAIETFSIRSGEFMTRMARAFDPWQKNPELRREVARVALARLQKLADDAVLDFGKKGKRAVPGIDSIAQLDWIETETERLLGRWLDGMDTNARQTYEAGLQSIEDQPLIQEMRGQGLRIMRRATALKQGLNIVDGKETGDYNGMPNLPASLMAKPGTGMLPDKIAQAIHDAAPGLVADGHADTLWNALQSVIASVEARNAAFKEINAKVKAAKKEAAETAKKLAPFEPEFHMEQRQKLKAYLRALDAILSASPAGMVGRVGGYTKLAALTTDESMVREIERRIERMGDLLERHLQKEYLGSIAELLEKFGSQTGAAGKPKSRTVAAVAEVVDFARTFSELEEPKQQGAIAELDAILDSADSTPEQIDAALQKKGIAELFYNLPKADAERLSNVHQWLATLSEEGLLQRKALDEERRAWVADMQAKASEAVMGKGVAPAELEEAQNVEGRINKSVWRKMVEKVKGMANAFLPSAPQLLEDIFGVEDAVADWAINAICEAANKATDIKRTMERERLAKLAQVFGTSSRFGMLRRFTELQQVKTKTGVFIQKVKTEEVKLPLEILTRIADGNLDFKKSASSKEAEWSFQTTAGAQVSITRAEADEALDQWAASEKKRSATITRKENVGNPIELEMSEMQAAQYLLHLGQKENRERAERHGYSADTIKQLQAFISPETAQIMLWFKEQYRTTGYGLVSPVYRRLMHAPLPHIDNYAPSVNDRGDGNQSLMDMDGAGGGSGLSAGFTISRKPHNRNIARADAATVFLQHFEHVAHWVSFVELVRDLRGVFQSEKVMNSIRAKIGPAAADALAKRIKAIETQGNNEAWSLGSLNQLAQGLNQVRAYQGLAFRLSPILKQTPAMLNPMMGDIPAHRFAQGLARFLAGQLDMKAIWKSETVQRRLDAGFSAEARLAMSATPHSPIGAQAVELMRRGMLPMQYMDAAWNVLGASIAYDYYLREAMAEHGNDAIAHGTAAARTQRLIDRTAQPVEMVNRSMVEGISNPWAKAAFLFRSEARKNLAIEFYAIKRLATGKSKDKAMDYQRAFIAHVAQAVGSQLMACFIASLLGDDDDREREWSEKQWAFAILSGPINGLFVFGDIASMILRRALGLRSLASMPPLEKAAMTLSSAGGNLGDLFHGNADEMMDEIDKLSAASAQGLGLFFGPVAGAPDAAANLLRDLRKASKRIKSLGSGD